MFSFRQLTVLFSLVFAAGFIAAAQPPVVVQSPNGALQLSIATLNGRSLQATGQLAYRVAFHAKPVLEWSKLGLALEGAAELGTAMRIESSQTSAGDGTWNSVAGKSNPIRDHYNAVSVQTVETTAAGRRLTIEARVYNDGVA